MSRPENENPQDRLEKTARELRKHRPRPSEALVSRIERLAERASSKRMRPARPWLSRRRLVFALAAALAISVAGAITAGQLRQSPKPVAVKESQKLEFGLRHLRAQTGTGSADVMQPYNAASGAGTLVQPTSKSARAQALGAPSPNESLKKSAAPVTPGKRLAELRAVLTLKVKDKADLSRQTARAMRIARSLGGYVATADYQVPSRGVAVSYLTLKVPATRSQDALSRISALGTILSQNVSLEDVQRTVTVETDRIKTLQQRIADLERSLSDSSLTSAARSRLQVQLASARANLNSLRAQRSANVRRGRLATIALTLTTGDLPKPAATPSRIHKAIDRAWNGLSSEISWAAMAIIVVSPFLLLASVLAVLVRIRKRREERRLLEQ